MTTNPNFPNLESSWGAMWNANGGSAPTDGYVDLSARTTGTIGTQRGRQYELDQVQAGTLTGTLANVDGLLDPANATGPWFGHIAPYQPYRLRAQWPATRNLLSPAVAECSGLAAGALPAGLSVYGLSPSVVASASAAAGTSVFQFAVPSGTVSAKWVGYTAMPSVTPGSVYAFTVSVRNVTDSTSLVGHAAIAWNGPVNGAAPVSTATTSDVTLTGSSTATGWTTFSFTATAPANASGAWVGFVTGGTAAAACNVQMSAWQWEPTSATAYQTPGTWYPIYTGFAERWPQAWNLDNTYSVLNPTAVDAFALLSQLTLSDAFTHEVNSHAPRFFYPLNDPAGTTAFNDQTGNLTALPTTSAKTGRGTVTAGVGVTATDPVNGTFTGAGQTVVTLANSNPGTDTNTGPASFFAMDAIGVQGFAQSQSTRMIAFRYTGPTPVTSVTLWSQLSKYGWNLSVGFNSAGKIIASGTPAVGTVVSSVFSNPSVLDGNWHLLHVVGTPPDNVNGIPAGYAYFLDGVSLGTTQAQPFAPAWDTIGSNFNGGTRVANENFYGDIADIAEFPVPLAQSDVTNMYTAWRNACAGESTGARYTRILRYSGYTGATSIDSGNTTSMGPAAFSGQDVLTALNEVVDTEGGAHFVATSGAVTFHSRGARYNALVPKYTFGERTDLGEFPYEEVGLDYDSTHLGNIVTVTQAATSQVFAAQDATSKANYFPRTLTRTVNATDPLECQDAADYLLSRYKNPATRVTTLKLHPAANTALWPVCLALELGTRVRVMRRPLGRPASTVDAFVENISWEFDENNDAFVTLQCSPVDTTPYGIFAAWHATFAAGTSVGATVITINAPKDNTNPLAAQITPGQQLVVSPAGTTSKEFVTVASVSSTGSPWTTGTITLTTGLAKSHTSGATICEPLPTGVTDPSTWDVPSTFDNHAFAY